MLHQLSIGLSGMQAAAYGLDVTGNNLANANTPGYRRQSLVQVERMARLVRGHWLGSGVNVQRVRQTRAYLVGNQLLTNHGLQAQVRAQLDVSLQIEGRLNPPGGSIAERFDGFHSSLEALAAAPYDSALRQTTVQSALSLTGQLNQVSVDLIQLQRTVEGQMEDTVGQVNALAEQIAALNFQINRSAAMNSTPNTLIDQRNALAEELSKLTDVRVDERSNHVAIAHGAIVIGSQPPAKLAVENGRVVLDKTGQDVEAGGLLGGLQAATQQIIPQARQRLDHLAVGLSLAWDTIHSQGVGLDGHLDRAVSSRTPADATAPLNTQPSPFPLSAGSLMVGVTDLSSGRRRLHEVAVDPATQSLQDLAAALDAVPNLNASIDASGRLVIQGDNGFGFDFTGRPPSAVDTSGLTGASDPSLGGRHQGPNQRVEFEFLGSGQVGVTPGLQVEARDADTGEVLGVYEIGEDYPPADPITMIGGATVSFGVGDVVSGEQFETHLVSDADESGVLVRLGINTLLTGTTAADLTLHGELLADPRRLAASATGEPGDGAVLAEMLGRRGLPVYPGSGETLDDALFTATGAIGHETSELSIAHEGLSLVGEQLFQERESIEGVDPNEELTTMLKYQRSFEAMARYLAAINQSLDDLMRVVG